MAPAAATPHSGRRLAARGRRPGASAIAPIRTMPMPRSTMRRRCAAIGQRAQAVAVLEQASLHNPSNMALLGAYGRALADVGNLQAGARRARPRAHARPARLAHPVGAGRGARSDGPPRRGAALLRERAQDRAGRALGAVQSRPVLRAVQGSRAAPRRRCGAPPPQPQRRSAGAAEPRAGGRPAGPLPGSRGDRARRPAAGRGRRQRRLSAADAGAAERLEEVGEPRSARAQPKDR